MARGITTRPSLTGLKVVEAGRVGRRTRSPKERFNLRSRPFEITPFLLHPVLPAETLKRLTFQTRVITDPIKNRQIGWWAEYYFFYVKHSDMPGRDDFQAMHLDTSTDLSAYEAGATTPWHYVANGDVNWSLECLKAVTEHYFRNDNEAWDDYVGDAGHPVAAVRDIGWLDSAVDADALAAAADENVVNEAGSAVVTAGEIHSALERYEFLRANNLTEAATYEDYLRSFGVRVAPELLHRPELLRMVSEWTYPSTHVADDGSTSTVVSWVVQGSADKDRFFSEPGFIFGVTVKRPKVYLENTVGSMCGLMRDAYTWLPAVLKDRPDTSLLTVPATTGPIPGQTSDYVVDIRDKLIYGGQFVNFALSATDAHLVPLPNDGLTNKDYPSSAFIDELFSGADPANEVDEDGMVQLQILGTQQDYT